LAEADGKGTELPSQTSGNQGFSGEGGAKSGALDAREAQNDPALRVVIEAWPCLPDPIKAGILAIVQAASNGAETMRRAPNILKRCSPAGPLLCGLDANSDDFQDK
jgi:hypothetical protein